MFFFKENKINKILGDPPGLASGLMERRICHLMVEDDMLGGRSAWSRFRASGSSDLISEG